MVSSVGCGTRPDVVIIAAATVGILANVRVLSIFSRQPDD
jgi:hypothetical protein